MIEIEEDVFNEIREWAKQGLAMREKLEQERATLRARLADVEGVLRTLPVQRRDTAEGGASALIREILSARPGEWLKGAEIVREAMKRGAKRNTLGSTLYRLRAAGKLKTRGPRGNIVYRLATDDAPEKEKKDAP